MSDLPVDSFIEAAPILRRPFTPTAVKFKLQVVHKNGGGGTVISYIDQRLVVERLNLVCPHLWHDEYKRTAAGGLLCHLTVDGITRTDVGEGTFEKAMFSDALKRAAVKFGVGVSLYAVPTLTVWKNQGQIETWEQQQGNKTVWKGRLTPEGEQSARTAYAAWLDLAGRDSFGEPLDHGDVEHAQGDVEVGA